MAKKKPLHQRNVPTFFAVVIIVTALVTTLAVTSHVYRQNNQMAEVASARTKVTQYSAKACDIDNNSKVNSNDLSILKQCVAKQKSCTAKMMSRSDINNDKKVNNVDVNAFSNGCKQQSSGVYQSTYSPGQASYQGSYESAYQARYQGAYEPAYQASYQPGYQSVYQQNYHSDP